MIINPTKAPTKMCREFCEKSLRRWDDDEAGEKNSEHMTSKMNADSTSTENRDNDDSDEETELTNLNWLIKNETIAWPNTTQPVLEDTNTILDHKLCENMHYERIERHLKWPPCTSQTANWIKRENGRCFKSQTQPQSKRPTPAERYEIFVNKLRRDLKEYEKFSNNYENDVSQKPPFNYSHIIGMAMLQNGRVTLQQICNWIESKFAFFRSRKKWNNSIRHNLSLHYCFRKIDRNRDEKGKGGYWELGIDPKKCDRKRIRNRKTSQSKTKRNLKPRKSSNADSENKTFGVHEKISTSLELNKQENEYKRSSDDSSNNYCITLNQSSMEETNIVQKSHLNITTISTSDELQEGHISLTEISLANLLSETSVDLDNQNINTFYAEVFPCPTPTKTSPRIQNQEEFVHLEQHCELGTIIISSTTPSVPGTANDLTVGKSSSFNCLINDKYNNPNLVYTEDEVPPASENIIISSYLSNDTIVENDHINTTSQDVIIENLLQPHTCAVMPMHSSSSCEYSSNFRPFIDGIDEYILDNLLDVCVGDY